MLTYDYTLDRIQGEGKSRRFVPDKIPKQLGNAVIIEGPNSIGKSTLLNIIALGFHGARNSRINPKLQSKMNALTDSDYQKLKFSFQITSENNDLTVKCEKPNSDRDEIIVKEGSAGNELKVISPENLERKYNLIYDIPDNPTERLNELLKELKDEQQQYGNKVKDFYFFLDRIIGQINSTRDPKRLEQIRDQLADVRKEKKTIEQELPKLEAFLDLLEKRAYIQYYCDYSARGEKLEREKQILEKVIEHFEKNGKKAITKLSKDKTRISSLQGAFRTNYDSVTPLIASALPKNEKARFRIWKDINPYQTESEDLNRARFEATHYIRLLGAEKERLRKDPSFKEASVWTKVFDALREFEDSGLLIPQLKVSLGEFVEILREETKKHTIIIQRYETLERIVSLLEELNGFVDELQTVQKQLKQEYANGRLSKDVVDTSSDQKEELEKMKVEQGILATKCNDYYQRCLSKGIDENKLEDESLEELIKDIPHNDQLEAYLSLGEKHVIEKIESLRKEIVGKRGRLSGLEMFVTQLAPELDRLEKQKPHKFESHLEQLNTLLRRTDAIRQKLLFEYNSNLKNLMGGKVSKSDLSKDPSRSSYFSEVSKYLAYRVGSFRHIDKIYRAKVVDLIDKIIVTDNDETIHMIDMGTGQEQSTYIMSLLNIDATRDPRKIIALFDEIAMMDEKSLEPICLRMEELKKENRLLLGILVQRSNQLKIRDISG